MPGPRRFHSEVRQLLRDRVLDVARDLVVDRGWTAVNMSRLAREVGISRAGLYNEFGTRQDLAGALVAREADRFLRGVVEAIDRHPGDIVDGLAAAAAHTLDVGDDNELLLSVVSGHRDESELLSLVAVDSETVLGRAMQVVADQIRAHRTELGEHDVHTVTEVFVRLTVSHLLQSRGPHADAIAQIRATVAGLLATLPAPAAG
ncbi:TetR family transcriptional regulator [Gordonia shandongensis]|uniref:TetR family transcriptional regulator n=1 Tax=Gordonia shandongensis TaxID=376351 RepID=UPI00040E03DC|nr:TetR family transcriptional regulator [Gordonia shandongensis]